MKRFFIIAIAWLSVSTAWSNSVVSEAEVIQRSSAQELSDEPIFNLFEKGHKLAIRFAFDSDFFNLVYHQRVSEHSWWHRYSCVVHVSEAIYSISDGEPGRLTSNEFYLFDNFHSSRMTPLSFKDDKLRMDISLFKNDGISLSDRTHGRMTVNEFRDECPDLEVVLVD